MTGENFRHSCCGREALIVEHLPLVNYLVIKICSKLPPHLEQQDMVSAATVGLINAVDRFDPERGVAFRTFAEQHIRGSIIDELRSLDVLSRAFREKLKRVEAEIATLEHKLGRNPASEEVASALGLDIEEYYRLLDDVRVHTFINIDDSWEDGDGNSLSIADILTGDVLDNPQYKVMAMQLTEALGRSIDTLPEKEKLAVTLYYGEELNLKEIGELIGVSESRVSQLLSQAMVRLRSRMKIHKN